LHQDQNIEVIAVFGDGTEVVLAATRESARAMGRGADLGTIDDQGVIVKAGNERRSGNRPESVLLFLHVHFRATPEVQSDLRSIWGLHANLYSAGTVNTRILRCPDIRRRRLKIA
jgi:hypothetical protein